MKATAMPWPAFTFFTIARARTSPPGTSNTIFTTAPTEGGSDVEMNSPPRPSVPTRDTERPPVCCHATSMPLGSFTRGNLRFTVFVSWPKANTSTPQFRRQLHYAAAKRDMELLCSPGVLCAQYNLRLFVPPRGLVQNPVYSRKL